MAMGKWWSTIQGTVGVDVVKVELKTGKDFIHFYDAGTQQIWEPGTDSLG